jgi:hypothetical protein
MIPKKLREQVEAAWQARLTNPRVFKNAVRKLKVHMEAAQRARLTNPRALKHAIRWAERILPGKPAPDGESDPRWQAIMKIEDFIESQAEGVWVFVRRWGKHPNPDLRSAIAVLLLEHLLKYHFDLIFPGVVIEVRKSKRFRDTLSRCWKLGQASKPRNAAKIDRLLRQ